jgi:hypothetical protein
MAARKGRTRREFRCAASDAGKAFLHSDAETARRMRRTKEQDMTRKEKRGREQARVSDCDALIRCEHVRRTRMCTR